MQLRYSAARASLLAMLLALLVPAGAAMATHVDVRDTDEACTGAPEDGFTDTGTAGSAREQAVDCISWYDITSGTSATTYGPGEFIKRGQMAAMIAESMRQSLTRFPEPGDDVNHFPDDDGNMFEPDIDFVAEYGVVRGKAGGVYDAGGFVTRAQMATFLVNQLSAIGVTIATPSTDYFDDDNDSQHEGNINKLASVGLASGRTHRGFEPTGNVTRGQMALFISRDLAELVEQGFMTQPDERVDTAEDGEHTNAVVATVARAADTFTVSADDEEHAAERFWYDDSDVFQDADGNAITMAEFEGLLTGPDAASETAADVVNVTYAHAPDEESTFQVVTDNVPPATNVVATAGDYDDDGDSSDVLIFWDASEQPNVLYQVYRDDDACGIPILAPADCQVGTDVTETSLLLTDEEDGDWTYYVVAESPTTGSTSSQATSNEVTVPAAASSSGRPYSQEAIFLRDGGNDGVANAQGDGDVWRFALSEPLAAVQAGDSLRVEGTPVAADGSSQGTVEHADSSLLGPSAGDATFELNSESMTVDGTTYGAGRVLTVTLLARPRAGQGADDPDAAVDLKYPLTVLYSTGLTDEEGDPVDWSAASGRDVAVGQSDENVNPQMESAAGNRNGTGPDQITVTFDQDVVCDGDEAEADNFTYTTAAGNDFTGTAITCDGDSTVVVSLQDGVFEPNTNDELTYTPDGDDVEDEFGNAAASGTVDVSG